jgi:hypothetical protein
MLDDQKLIGNLATLTLFDDSLLKLHSFGVAHTAEIDELKKGTGPPLSSLRPVGEIRACLVFQNNTTH